MPDVVDPIIHAAPPRFGGRGIDGAAAWFAVDIPSGFGVITGQCGAPSGFVGIFWRMWYACPRGVLFFVRSSSPLAPRNLIPFAQAGRMAAS